MLPWIIQMSIISLIVIALVHNLFTFFKTNLTTPKVKDLVNKPQKQYDALFNTMRNPIYSSSKQMNDSVEHSKNDSSTTTNSNMKNELKNYLKELSETKKSALGSSGTTGISSVPNLNNNDGIMTGENIMANSFESNSYSSF